jgi:FAD-dependent urate hydroxylase
MERNTHLLIIGAGPYGLAMAAYAAHLGIEHVIVGKPMEFWKANMPEGMYLRSPSGWSLDPVGVHSLENYLAMQGATPGGVEPLSLQFYSAYAQWFLEQKRIDATPALVRRLDWAGGADRQIHATLDDGRIISARHVVNRRGLQVLQVPAPGDGRARPRGALFAYL